jgi:serine/threonine protein kinase
MRCPRCQFEGNPVNGQCMRCGYDLQQGPSSLVTATRSRQSSELSILYTLRRGDTLFQGRYRILNQITLPEPQQKQGTAWLGVETHSLHRHVIIRQITIPQELARASSRDRIVTEAAQRLHRLGQYAGFPKVIDLFNDKRANFLVQLYPEGDSLAALLNRQSGALPEPVVAKYGFQLCGLLSVLADQQPPIIHGSINPETIIINEASQRVSLIHLPLFPPDKPSTVAGNVPLGYYAPEQVRGEVDPSIDLYALAATMHHAVTGYDPQARLIFFHPPARRLNPAVTPQMEKILAKQLSLSKSQRYQHPSEMQKNLEALIASYPEPTNDQPPTFAADPFLPSASQLREQSRSVTLLNMGVFAAIGVLLIIGVLFAILRP